MRTIAKELNLPVSDKRMAANAFERSRFVWMLCVVGTPAGFFRPSIRIKVPTLKENAWLESEGINIPVPCPCVFPAHADGM
jgi:hypothetical protein